MALATRDKLSRIDPLNIARVFGEFGASDTQLAHALGITLQGVTKWKKRNPMLVATLNQAKEVADARVAKSLYQRALGYSHKSEKIFMTKDGEIVRAETMEHYPPDATSMIFWLKNRQPLDWREKREDQVNVAVQVNGLPVEFVQKLRDATRAKLAPVKKTVGVTDNVIDVKQVT